MKANKMPSAKNERRNATRGSKATQREGERQKMKFVWVYPALDMPFAARAALRDCSAPLINEPEFYRSSKQQQQGGGSATPLLLCTSHRPQIPLKLPLRLHLSLRFADFPLPRLGLSDPLTSSTEICHSSSSRKGKL